MARSDALCIDLPITPDPLHLATCDKILETAHRHGIKCVMHCASAAFARAR
jgi:hypothetical protein